MSINVAQAALGTRLSVPTLEGNKQEVEVAPGTQSGAILRLRGLGVPHLRGNGRGDLLVLLRVEVPKKLSDEQRQLFRQLAATLDPDAVVETREPTFLERVREALGL